MRIIRDFETVTDAQGAVLALGNFDGVHLGHRAILAHTVALARDYNTRAAVMTFEPHPREFFAPDAPPLRIYPLRRKLELIRECGIETVFLMRFNAPFAATSAADFVHNILGKKLGARHVITGDNFAFGKGRGGDSAFLAREAQAAGFGFTAHPPVHGTDNALISSSGIRTLLAAGDITHASAALAHPYDISGRVMHGLKRGRELGFPTANLSLDGLFKPRFGVYAGQMSVENGPWLDAVMNIGIRPTLAESKPLLEVHALDSNRDMYGKRICVRPFFHLRDEQKFADMAGLKKQIEQDAMQSQTLLAKQRTL
jgi:riboflavin kinase/FMN adenylyltransferase